MVFSGRKLRSVPKESQIAAAKLGLQIYSIDVNSADKFEEAFKEAVRARSAAVSVTGGSLNTAYQKFIADLAAKYQLPAIFDREDFIANGGLMSYGPDRADSYRRAAVYVDKILKGAKPGELPVEQPTKFELVINLKTAKQIGLAIPPNVLARANSVIIISKSTLPTDSISSRSALGSGSPRDSIPRINYPNFGASLHSRDPQVSEQQGNGGESGFENLLRRKDSAPGKKTLNPPNPYSPTGLSVLTSYMSISMFCPDGRRGSVSPRRTRAPWLSRSPCDKAPKKYHRATYARIFRVVLARRHFFSRPGAHNSLAHRSALSGCPTI